MQTPYQQNQRYNTPPGDHRQQYIPPPPPPPPPAPAVHQNQGFALPGPPPRPHPSQAGGTWSQAPWGRQPQFIPPPPPFGTSSTPARYDPTAYSNYQQNNTMISSPISSDSQPLTSATYIPLGESFGVGVGIPPLYPGPSSADHLSSSMPDITQDIENGEILHSNYSNDSPRAVTAESGVALSNNQHILDSALEDELELQWPVDRVVTWLAMNNFSKEWQQTFETLDVHGSKFLEIGQGRGGVGNLSMMHTQIFPQLQKECIQSNIGWDATREQNESRRLRKLIRRTVDPNAGKTLGPRRSSSNYPPAPEGTQDDQSLALKHDGAVSTPSTAGAGQESPGFDMPPKSLSPPINSPQMHRRFSNQRAPPSSYPSRQNGAKPLETVDGLAVVEGRKTHTPNDSVESLGTSNHRAELSRVSNETSPQLSPALIQGRQTPNSSAAPKARYYHLRNRSSESNPPGSATIGPTSHWNLDNQSSANSGRGAEVRRNGQDVARSPAFDTSRNTQQDGKEHRGSFLPKLLRRKGKEDAHPSPEDSILSPASPYGHRASILSPPFARQINSSDPDLSTQRPKLDAARRTSSGFVVPKPRIAPDSEQPRRYILVTPDTWNYRLVDVSGVESAEDFYSIVCYEVGIPDPRDLSVFITSPGQIEHEEPLPDHLLLQTLAKTDALATTKIFVRTPHQLLRSAGLGLSVPGSAFSSPMVKGQPLMKSRDASSGTLSPEPASNGLKVAVPTQRPASSDGRISTTGRPSSRNGAANDSQGEEKMKRPHRKPTPSMEGPEAGSANSIKGSGVIDFDEPRSSPYLEDRFVPVRKPPPVPPDSTTLIKANSLSRKNGSIVRNSWSERDSPNKRQSRRRAAVAEAAQEASPIANAVANVGRLSITPVTSGSSTLSSKSSPPPSSGNGRQRAIASVNFGPGQSGRQSPAGSPRNGRVTMSPKGVPFNIPAYMADENDAIEPLPESAEPTRKNPQLHKIMTQDKPAVNNVSPDVSPSTTQPPARIWSRRTSAASVSKGKTSRALTGEIEEKPIAFNRTSPARDGDSDEDSDDGLFAVPLNSKQSSSSVSTRPSLTIKTDSTTSYDSRNTSKSLSIVPTNESKDSLKQSESSATEYNDSSSAGPQPRSGGTRDPEKDERRKSFASDVWAARPPPEALVENLDEFFPNVDLDMPMLDAAAGLGSATPSSATAFQSPLGDTISALRTVTPNTSEDELDGPTLHKKPTFQSMAKRNINRAGGLGRTKSIREVVKGTYQQRDKSSVPVPSQVNKIKAENIVRRKSTKMFGTKIEQIKPDRGSRVISLNTIPQGTIAQDTIDTRRTPPTCQWVKGQLIGKGTFGRVYLGMNTTTGELIAVKQVEVNPRQAGSDKEKIKEMVKALDQEIDTMQHLDHVNIVQYLGCERKEYSISILLEYISGGSIGSCLRKHGKFEESVVSSLTRQTLNGLAYLHHAGILHRDLKADNILLDLDGTCKISDFGISKKSDNIYGNDASNSMQGSIFWMAPEVVRSQGKGYSAKVDIWSLGCVVLEMFAGRRPWSKEEAVGAIYKLGSLNQAPPIPEEVSSTITPTALSFMWDCFNVDPADRPTADTLLRATFCSPDPHFNFYDTELYAKIRPHR